MNLYWGELHLHTAESFDASLFGTTLGFDKNSRTHRGRADDGTSHIEIEKCDWRPEIAKNAG